jgi:hypothetical protein
MVHLAQYNIARARAPLSDPLMADFVGAIPRLNELAERTPGFVWRLKDDSGASSSYVRAHDDERLLVNLSVWESIESLRAYAYGPEHLEIFRRRAEWFEPHTGPWLVLWWVPAGHAPPVEEAHSRLTHLAEHGPDEFAFTFQKPAKAQAV